MIRTETKLSYEAFGLHVESDFAMPELRVHRDQEHADIRIRKADLSRLWQRVAKPRKLIYVLDHNVLFQVPDTATFYIESGLTITVSPLGEADEDKIRLYILGTCMAIVLLQRKILPLHGSAINIGGKAYAIVGESGAGKSTLASVLVRRGFSFVSDDLIAVSFDERGDPIIFPSYPQQKLWKESIQQLNMNVSRYRPLFERENKYAIPIDEGFHSEPIPFGGVFELVKASERSEPPNASERSEPLKASERSELLKASDRPNLFESSERPGRFVVRDAATGSVMECRAINGLHGIQLLYKHTFRNFFIARLHLQDWHFHTSVRLLKHIHAYELRRPATGSTAHILADMIISTIQGGIGNETNEADSSA